jgi:glycosyltransferase involved in cell wall biosynthesis
VVLNDLAARRFPNQLHRPSAWFYGHFAPWTLRFAPRILAISNFTAKEAVDLLNLPADRLVTVLQGGDSLASPESGPDDAATVTKYNLPEKYIVHIGTLEPRKNLAFLVRAFTRFAMHHPEYQLLLVGKDGWKSSDLHSAIADSSVRDRVRLLGAVSDSEKRVILRRSRALAFPSMYEGFGLPPLEAMRSGVPVVASRTSSIPEVVGDAGLLLAGYNEDAWSDAFTLAVTEGSERTRLQTAGLARAGQFSWQQTAHSIATILHQVVHEHSR